MTGWGALLGGACGFGASVAPDLLAMIREHFTHRREIECKEQELSAAKEGYEFAAAEQQKVIDDQTSAIAALTQQLIADNEECGHGWVDSWISFWKAAVRPTLTFAFFMLFAFVKVVSMWHAYRIEHLSVVQALPVLWDDETETLFSGVMAFWFGSRALGNRPAKGSNNGSNSTRSKLSTDLAGTGRIVGE